MTSPPTSPTGTEPTDKVGPNGTYTTPRPCPHCGAEFLSRDAYWRHYFTTHEDTP